MTITNTIRLLKREQPDREKIEKVFAKKSDEVLLSAIVNPEHSDAAREILRTIAEQRGLQAGEVLGWEQTEQAMYVKPFGNRPTFEDALAAPRRRRRLYRTLQVLMVIGLIGGIFAFIQSDSTYKEWVQEGINKEEVDPAVVGRFRAMNPAPSNEEIYQYLHVLNLFAEDLRKNYEPGTFKADVFVKTDADFIETYGSVALPFTSSPPGNQPYVDAFFKLYNSEIDYINELSVDDPYAFAFDHFSQYSAFEPQGPGTPPFESIAIVLLFGGFALWLLVGIFSWTRPCRTLLLRPFQAKKVSKPLKRFARKNLSFYGHTITLSDKYVKESRLAYALSWVPRGPVDLVLIPLFFIPSIRQFQRWIHAKSARSYRFLKKRLARRFTMNMFWQNSYNKLLMVKCSDVWWKQAVDLLMYSCQVIVVDVSWVKTGTEWELNKIDHRDLERKTLFVVSESAAEYARDVVARFWPGDEAPPPLYIYRNSGKLIENEAYHREVARIISESHLWDGPRKRAV